MMIRVHILRRLEGTFSLDMAQIKVIPKIRVPFFFRDVHSNKISLIPNMTGCTKLTLL